MIPLKFKLWNREWDGCLSLNLLLMTWSRTAADWSDYPDLDTWCNLMFAPTDIHEPDSWWQHFVILLQATWHDVSSNLISCCKESNFLFWWSWFQVARNLISCSDDPDFRLQGTWFLVLVNLISCFTEPGHLASLSLSNLISGCTCNLISGCLLCNWAQPGTW